MLMKTLCFFGLGMASALHLPTCTGRRGALASAAALGLPAAALALPAFEKEGIEGLRPETKKKRMKPDGFGGFVAPAVGALGALVCLRGCPNIAETF